MGDHACDNLKGRLLNIFYAREHAWNRPRVCMFLGMCVSVGGGVLILSAQVVKAATAEKLLLVGAGDNTVRVMPPLNVTDADLAEGVERLSRALAHVSKSLS